MFRGVGGSAVAGLAGVEIPERGEPAPCRVAHRVRHIAGSARRGTGRSAADHDPAHRRGRARGAVLYRADCRCGHRFRCRVVIGIEACRRRQGAICAALAGRARDRDCSLPDLVRGILLGRVPSCDRRVRSGGAAPREPPACVGTGRPAQARLQSPRMRIAPVAVAGRADDLGPRQPGDPAAEKFDRVVARKVAGRAAARARPCAPPRQPQPDSVAHRLRALLAQSADLDRRARHAPRCRDRGRRCGDRLRHEAFRLCRRVAAARVRIPRSRACGLRRVDGRAVVAGSAREIRIGPQSIANRSAFDGCLEDCLPRSCRNSGARLRASRHRRGAGLGDAADSERSALATRSARSCSGGPGCARR